MDLRERTALFCSALALAIAISVVLRSRVRAHQALFAAFATNVGLWYLAQALFGLYGGHKWGRTTEFLAALLPQLAVRLFVAIVPRTPTLTFSEATEHTQTRQEEPTHPLVRVATVAFIPMAALIASPYHEHDAVRAALFVYVGVLTSAALGVLAFGDRKSRSRSVRRRTTFLAVVGTLATTLSLSDFLWWVGARLPPIGAVLSIVFLYVLSQSLQSPRLLDLYDLAGRLTVATAMAFCIAGIFWMFVSWVGRFSTMYLNAVLASIAILVLLGPLQAKVEEKIHQLFFRERFDLERAVNNLRRQLAHVLDVEEMVALVLAGLEPSRRVTSHAIFLHDDSLAGAGDTYVLRGHVGTMPKAVRIEEGSARALLDRLARGPIVREDVEREISDALESSDAHAVAQSRDLYMRVDALGAGVILPLAGSDGELFGMLVVNDERVRDAFGTEDVALLAGLAGQIATVVGNSRAYARVKERDRLTALGAMAAGLAHEVKNPLGAIKGAAQLMSETNYGEEGNAEFLGIILEEVDRLDRVVSSILDYARPRSSDVESIDVNAAVRRTMQILSPTHGDLVDVRVNLTEDLPLVRIDPEQLRQVLMNLVTNAAQAMGGSGKISVSTSYRRLGRTAWPVTLEHGGVEIRVVDTGPGISTKVLKNLFVPFFTTKSSGTGLGLAISQRIAQNAGGFIEVQSTAGVGTTFVIILPAANAPESAGPPSSAPASSEVGEAT